MDSAVPAQSHHLRDATRIIPIGFVAHRGERNPHMARFRDNYRNSGRL
jgi:hypothetical protein